VRYESALPDSVCCIGCDDVDEEEFGLVMIICFNCQLMIAMMMMMMIG